LDEQGTEPLAVDPLWDSPGLWTAWGFAHGEWPASTLAARAAGAGFRWVALQAGQHTAADAEAVRAAGLKYVVWGLAPFDAPTAADGCVVQVEDSEQYAAALAQLPKLGGARAVVTTFGGADTPELVGPLALHASVALVECYRQDDPIHAQIGRMMGQAKHDGWPAARPVIGMWGGVGLDAYPELKPGGYSVWNAEQLSDDGWAQLTAFNT
jgi:hypothetical protein